MEMAKELHDEIVSHEQRQKALNDLLQEMTMSLMAVFLSLFRLQNLFSKIKALMEEPMTELSEKFGNLMARWQRPTPFRTIGDHNKAVTEQVLNPTTEEDELVCPCPFPKPLLPLEERNRAALKERFGSQMRSSSGLRNRSDHTQTTQVLGAANTAITEGCGCQGQFQHDLARFLQWTGDEVLNCPSSTGRY